MKEELPVDEWHELRERRLDRTHTGERGHRRIVVLEQLTVGARRVERQQRPALLLRVLNTQALLLLPVVGIENAAANRVEQVGDDADDAGGVEDVHRLAAVRGCDPDGRVLAGGRRTADQQRQLGRACISFATCTISSSDGVIEPERLTASAPASTAVSRIVSPGTITPRSMTS